MMLFSDEIGRLYLIFVDTNRKQTWVPLPSSRTSWYRASEPVESAPTLPPGASAMLASEATEQPGTRYLEDVPETSTGAVIDTSLVLSGSA